MVQPHRAVVTGTSGPSAIPFAENRSGEPRLSVVICCYTERRRQQVEAAIVATAAQLGDADELIIVVDHNPDLSADLAAGHPGLIVVANKGIRGLSEARNTGTDTASGDVVVFIDDDARPAPGALKAVRARMAEAHVAAIGGAVEARWETAAPEWFPDEFGWVVGCDYLGLPHHGAAIRNPIGAAMAVRRDALLDIGGFSPALGRRGALPAGCEETLMGIALRERNPNDRIVRDTTFRVTHLVPDDRGTFRYFTSRCYHEGRSKAVLASLTGADAALASERRYTTRVLPAGVWRHRRSPRRCAALVAGFLWTCAGYARGLAERRSIR
ncbi:glycosyltransferase family 2 protein [Gordonia alkanivorans]|uniref:glycosyltransferase family 2 protein n=1 Tax=Gordonia alkanivorans TaxID=84096 RepID=UPI001E4C63CE|nr:glycosyltransferase family 2 protein [Gordonia alkanivorans]MDH3020974.1 glycosyltransferase family 2 protein [Gordonia alkanivorans]MDH3026628.1 glycosyltransferase family 2 protein [Gordonia alkanivorans]MDH3047998.1 glycosyltransferase family 2 protein [Gordonia alkanivorans]MDJ0008464.1 glycosyltransferase family 2 protein [Gordonia alkanivorans]MDJ0098316.1 glycosyltransferase family 2 protein [Gordonia alkanivorans]